MTMPAETLTALRGSIEKWRKVVQGDYFEAGPCDCPLCIKFRVQDNQVSCAGCPVAAKTGYPGCDNSPYTAWSDAYDEAECYTCINDAEPDDQPMVREAAQTMLDFLIGLQPPELCNKHIKNIYYCNRHAGHPGECSEA